MIIVQCEKPLGCGWWWRASLAPRAHWWSRRDVRLFGPFWPDGPPQNTNPRWITLDQLADDYGDCWQHLRQHRAVSDAPG